MYSLCLNVFRGYVVLQTFLVASLLMIWGKCASLSLLLVIILLFLFYEIVHAVSLLCYFLQGSFFWFGCFYISMLYSLGKTLQSITLLYTLLWQGFDGKPMVKKAIIVTPTSLVSNWEAEIKKWVGERVKLIALCESTRDDVVSGIDTFRSPHSSSQVSLCN